MKRMTLKTGISIALSLTMLISCFFSVPAYAVDGTGTTDVSPPDQVTQQTDHETGAQTKSKSKESTVPEAKDNNDKASGSNSGRSYKSENAGDGTDYNSLDDTLRREALSTIIAKDAEGKELFYTTLYDSSDRIVDTNDPKHKQDDHYKPESEGGKGGTVDPGASLKVRFRMAEMIEHDGDKGIQENTIYYMELPKALVPVKKDSSGKQLVDPEEQVVFFRDGDIGCAGGIYTEEDGYQLQMQFENVEDQMEISGGFQYGVTVSEELKKGESCTVDYVPGGSLSFTVTPDKEEPITSSEKLTLSASDNKDSKDRIDWTLTLTDSDGKLEARRLKVKLDKGSAILADKGQSNAEDVIKMSSVKITYKDGTTETLKPYRMNSNAFSYYRESDSYDPTTTYDKDKDRGIFCTAYIDESDRFNEKSIIEHSGRCSLVDTLYIDMCALKSNSSNAGNNSGSTNSFSHRRYTITTILQEKDIQRKHL